MELDHAAILQKMCGQLSVKKAHRIFSVGAYVRADARSSSVRRLAKLARERSGVKKCVFKTICREVEGWVAVFDAGRTIHVPLKEALPSLKCDPVTVDTMVVEQSLPRSAYLTARCASCRDCVAVEFEIDS